MLKNNSTEAWLGIAILNSDYIHMLKDYYCNKIIFCTVDSTRKRDLRETLKLSTQLSTMEVISMISLVSSYALTLA